MTQASLGKRLSAQDASFLYMEKEEAPMHIGSIAVLEGEMSFAKFVDSIAAKIHLIPRYMQRIVPAPFNIGHPTWEWDPDFNITNHLKRVTIDAPGTDAQLMELASRLFASLLPRDKPLWEIYLVEGLEGGRSALVSKVHHCLVDGVSGIELLMIIMDVAPNPPPPLPAPVVEREPAPPALNRFFDAIFDNLSLELDRISQTGKNIADSVVSGDDRVRPAMRALETTLPYLTVPVDRAPFNRPLVPGRVLAGSEFSFAEIRAIRGACGGTVNDVVLTVLGGALGRYLEMHGQSTEGRAMRILTPVNVRREGERGALGNRISMLLVEVPVGVHDPIERLNLVNARTDALKRRNVADGVELLGEMLNGAPPALQALMGSLPPPPNTLANMVCTNVPGPMIPLYSVGHRLLAHYPLVPIAWEMGIGCGVTSYDQKLYFGLIGDGELGEDVQRLKEFLDQSFIELRSAAGVAKSDLPQMGVGAAPPATRRRRASPARSESLAADAG